MLTHGCCLHVLKGVVVFFVVFLHSNLTALVVALLLSPAVQDGTVLLKSVR